MDLILGVFFYQFFSIFITNYLVSNTHAYNKIVTNCQCDYIIPMYIIHILFIYYYRKY